MNRTTSNTQDWRKESGCHVRHLNSWKKQFLRRGRIDDLADIGALTLVRTCAADANNVVCRRIAAWVGDKDFACEQLARATHLPSGGSYGELKLLPWWDPLRSDPRFEKIVTSLAPK